MNLETSALMPDHPSSAALSSPAALRNRDPILAALQAHLPATGIVLEIAAGTGEHAVHFAAAHPELVWQPTDPDADALASIDAWRLQAGIANLRAPLRLDVTSAGWPIDRADVIVAINMIHIAPWAASEGLMAGAERLLPPSGLLFLYGPYLEADVETTPSNLAFDASLKSRNATWGLRRIEEVAALAAGHGLTLVERRALPANNLAIAFRKTQS